MKHNVLSLIVLLAALPALFSCSDLRQTKDLYDEWWPVHASGSYENSQFTARWDGNLGIHGDISVTFVNKDVPDITYQETRYYEMLSFSKARKGYCTISIESLGNMHATSKYLQFYIKDKKLFLEIPNSSGRGTGEYAEGVDISFPDDNTVKIGTVTYERYSYFKEKHPEVFKPLAEMGFDLETPPIIFDLD